MLTATKSKPFERWFTIYNRYYLIGRRFRSFGMTGNVDPPDAGDRPVLYMMNHSTWWDGLLVCLAVRQRSAREHYMMMEERQLRKYGFFRKLGAYSIDRERPADIRASLRYTASLLRQGAGAWIFPQGEIRHVEERPLRFKPGIGLILKLVPQTVVVPVTLYHGFGRHEKPEASIRFGDPLLLPWRELTSRSIADTLEMGLTEQLDQHKGWLVNSPSGSPRGLEPLIRTGKSVNERFEAWKDFGAGLWR
ncbi:lysophospholipid acyltransferase family protein [Paenibacillus sp. SAF-054]|uniref:lysophospholipid acyltransferase family protein n=1 Tax=unclassified Paenibacillus TaxID=185978 RepID=UPI003F80959C